MSTPAGAGKSQTFELAPYAFDCSLGEDCNAIVFVARYRDLSDLLRSPIVSHVSPQMSFIA